jgi:hypothetical protein
MDRAALAVGGREIALGVAEGDPGALRLQQFLPLALSESRFMISL